MQRLETSAAAPWSSPPRGMTMLLAYGGVLFCLMLWLARLLLAPDPTGDLFAKAQRLEARGQIDLALRGYQMLTDHHPDSPYAPQALQKQGDILASIGRRTGDKNLLRQSLAVYEHLANDYQNTPLAGPAFLMAGKMAYDRDQLGDLDAATRIYTTMLARYPNNADYASQASVKLGRIALERGQNDEARKRFMGVLRAYPRLTEQCAEALFHLGWLAERQNNRDGAKDIYRATLKRYPGSASASDARERLGMLSLNDPERPHERRVLLDVAPLPEETDAAADASLLAALRPLLAARGLETSAATLGGWSLQPFYAGFNPQNPSFVPRAPFDTTRNIIANAGLRMTQWPTRQEPLQELQHQLDMDQAPMVFDGRWQLCVGYDSARLQVFLQHSGAQLDVVPVKDFMRDWGKPSPLGQPFAMLTFWAPSDKPQRASAKPTPNSSVTPAKTAAPTPTPFASIASILSTPTIQFQLPPLSSRAAHARTLAHATQWMRRPRDGQTLLNASALQALERELRFLSHAPVSIEPGLPPEQSPVPTPETGADAGTESLSDAEDVPQRAQAAPTQAAPAPRLASMRDLNRTRALLGWFGAPLNAYLDARRDATAYLDAAGDALKNPALHRGAQEFATEVAALERARDALPASDALSQDGRTLDAPARRALNAAALEIGAARQAEARAVSLMNAKA